jgi:hypothetical protein
MHGAILQDHARTEGQPLVSLEPVALAATRAAALACQYWIGRGSGKDADQAATEAMRAALSHAPAVGSVVVGERLKDEAPMLFDGEQLGTNEDFQFDITADPFECTTLVTRRGFPARSRRSRSPSPARSRQSPPRTTSNNLSDRRPCAASSISRHHPR